MGRLRVFVGLALFGMFVAGADAPEGCGLGDPDECDIDGDGYYRWECEGHDCDDAREDIHPAAPDACNDGLDQNCDGWDMPREDAPDWEGC